MNPAPSYMHYVYILKSKRSKWVYIGCTSDLDKRINEHNSGESTATRPYLPLEIVYYEAYRSKKDAFEREKHLKQHGNALGLLKKRIQQSLVEEGAG